METMEPVTRSRSRRHDAFVFLAGFTMGCFVIAMTCVGNWISDLSTIDTRNDFLTTNEISDGSAHQIKSQEELETVLDLALPDSTSVTRMDEVGWEEPWLSMVFRTSEAHASELTALLDERYPVLGAEELVGMKSFGEGGVMTPPVRAWKLPKESQVQMLVVRLVRVSDGKAIWVVEDHLK